MVDTITMFRQTLDLKNSFVGKTSANFLKSLDNFFPKKLSCYLVLIELNN